MLRRLTSAGFAAYAVGGCVRDSLAGRAPQDWDICTSARPEAVMRVFAAERTVPTGIRFGTVTLIFEGETFEITTFRSENGYFDARHPQEVDFLTDLRGDLARRDFTVNAMAADADGVVTDLFGGRADLQNGVLRCVGDPNERFSEDALRILRGLRFAARFDLTVEAATAAAMTAQRERLRAISAERVQKELCGLLRGRAAARVLREFAPIVWVVLPELRAEDGFCQYNFHHAETVWAHTLAALDSAEAEVRLAVLLHDVGKPSAFSFDRNLVGHFYGHAIIGAAMTERALRRLRFDKETIRQVTELVRYHDIALYPLTEKRMRRVLALLGEEQTRRLLRVRRADRLGKGTEDPAEVEAFIAQAEACLADVLRRESCFSRNRLAVSGRELMAAGIPQGRRLGTILDALLREVIEERLQNDAAILVQYAQMLNDKLEND